MSEDSEPTQKKIVVLKKEDFETLKNAMGSQGELTSEESLKAENEDLKEKLSLVAERALSKRLSDLGEDPSRYDLKNPDSQKLAVDRLHELERTHGLNTGAPLSEAQYTGKKPEQHSSGINKDDVLTTYSPLEIPEIAFDSQKEMFAVLKAIAKDPSDPRQKDAKKKLSQLLKKELHKGEEVKTFELEGSVSEWLRNGRKSKPTFKKLNEEEGE